MPEEEVTAFEDALAKDDVAWCQGKGCTAGSAQQHLKGFRSATKVHLTFPPDPEDREALHHALRLVGTVVVGRQEGMSARERNAAAYDYATGAMRDAGLSVPRAITSAKPDATPRPRTSAPMTAPEAPAEPDAEPSETEA